MRTILPGGELDADRLARLVYDELVTAFKQIQ